MINVLWNYNDGFWDAAFPQYLLSRIGDTVQHFQGIQWAKDLVGTKVGVIVIPGRHSMEDYEKLNEAAASFRRVVFMIIGDEEGHFRSDKLKHLSAKVWWFMPPLDALQAPNVVLPNGWPGDALELIARAHRHRDGRVYDYSFAGQVTHKRREDCMKAATQMTPHGFLYHTAGFAQGLPRQDYYDVMVHSKFVLCPSGPCTPDSFRFAEALESGCVPIVDAISPRPGHPEGYWEYLFNTIPFPVIYDWSELPELFHKILPRFDELQEACADWWSAQKDSYVKQLREDLCLT